MADEWVVGMHSAAWSAAFAAWMGAIVNAAVVAAAFGVQNRQLRADRKLASDLEDRSRQNAATAALNAIAHVHKIQVGLNDQNGPMRVIDAVAGARISHLILDHYVDRDPEPPELVSILISFSDVLRQLSDELASANNGEINEAQRALAGECMVELATDRHQLQRWAGLVP